MNFLVTFFLVALMVLLVSGFLTTFLQLVLLFLLNPMFLTVTLVIGVITFFVMVSQDNHNDKGDD